MRTKADVIRGAHKGDSNGVHAATDGKLQVVSSLSVSDGTRTGIPGRLMPFFSPSMPPLMTSYIRRLRP